MVLFSLVGEGAIYHSAADPRAIPFCIPPLSFSNSLYSFATLLTEAFFYYFLFGGHVVQEAAL